MQPELAPESFHRPGWVYEEKYDGWRPRRGYLRLRGKQPELDPVSKLPPAE